MEMKLSAKHWRSPTGFELKTSEYILPRPREIAEVSIGTFKVALIVGLERKI
jgi:hypothetical protein